MRDKTSFKIQFLLNSEVIRSNLSQFSDFYKKILNRGTISTKSKKLQINEIPKVFNVIIIDFQGESPIKCFGFLCQNNIYSFIPHYAHIDDFLLAIVKILRVFKNSFIFSFSMNDYESVFTVKKEIMNNINRFQIELNDLENIHYINLQKREDETLYEVLYPLDKNLANFLIPEKIKALKRWYEDKNFSEIHNIIVTYLKAKLILFLHRYLKTQFHYSNRLSLDYNYKGGQYP